MTKFRVGLALGLSAGYYFGTKASHKRHEQLNRVGRIVRRNSAIDQAVTAVGKARVVIDLSRERVHTPVDHTAPVDRRAMSYVAP